MGSLSDSTRRFQLFERKHISGILVRSPRFEKNMVWDKKMMEKSELAALREDIHGLATAQLTAREGTQAV
jgi:hypothetical protein